MKRALTAVLIGALAASPAYAAKRPPMPDDVEATDHELPVGLDWSQPPPDDIASEPTAAAPAPPTPHGPAVVASPGPAIGEPEAPAPSTAEPTIPAPAATPAEPAVATVTATSTADPPVSGAVPTAERTAGAVTATPIPEPAVAVATPTAQVPVIDADATATGVPTPTDPALTPAARANDGRTATNGLTRRVNPAPSRSNSRGTHRPRLAAPSQHRPAVARRRQPVLRVPITHGRAAVLMRATAHADEYLVRPGDTLTAIAARHGTSWPLLWALNRDRIADPDLIYPGQPLRVPRAPG